MLAGRPTACASAAAPIERGEMRDKTTYQNADDLVREAVGCKRSYNGSNSSGAWCERASACGTDRVNKKCSPRARAGQSQNQIVRPDRGSTSVDHDHPELGVQK
jgi:hypothetical protein